MTRCSDRRSTLKPIRPLNGTAENGNKTGQGSYFWSMAAQFFGERSPLKNVNLGWKSAFVMLQTRD